MRLEGKKAVVTGGASGFGKETALLFAREGAEVALIDLNLPGAEEVAEEIRKAGGKAWAFQADVSDEASVKKAFAGIFASMGVIDILINIAGFGRGGWNIEDLSVEQWERLIDVNLKGVFLCSREVIPHMEERKYGKIVSIASICGQCGRKVAVDYAASKAGVIGLTRALAMQVAKYGVNVNAIAPGPIVTPIFEKNYTPDQIKVLMDTIPFSRMGTTMDVANLFLFLASDESGWITGECVAVNGGAYMG
ncbi:MAG: SDR family oxidoreductase [Oscillospiraceae bacterium]|nr:SDR family oxidoreductase [Oscillospiraceae bacterium]